MFPDRGESNRVWMYILPKKHSRPTLMRRFNRRTRAAYAG